MPLVAVSLQHLSASSVNVTKLAFKWLSYFILLAIRKRMRIKSNYAILNNDYNRDFIISKLSHS